MSRQTILVTGFGPFPGAAQNPSAVLVEALSKRARKTSSPDAELNFATLPTHWQHIGPALKALQARHKPDICLHLGYSCESLGFQLERIAHNATCCEPDIDEQPGHGGCVLENHPAQLTTDLPLETIAIQLSASGFSCTCSNNAGHYLCNTAYFLALAHTRSSLFIHIPAIKTEGEIIPLEHEGDHYLQLEEAIKGMQLIISTLMN